jgi:hypothetical protein
MKESRSNPIMGGPNPVSENSNMKWLQTHGLFFY